MTVLSLPNQTNLAEAFLCIKDFLSKTSFDTSCNFAVRVFVENIFPHEFCIDTNGIEQFFYQSRDVERKYVGIAAASLIKNEKNSFGDALKKVCQNKASLLEGQFYFGGLRFDHEKEVSSEWNEFATEIFVMPLMLLAKESSTYFVQLNFFAASNMPISIWKDFAFTLLNINTSKSLEKCYVSSLKSAVPSENSYAQSIKKALANFSQQNQKVVLARRSEFLLRGSLSFSYLLKKLTKIVDKSFLFIFDLGNKNIFFGASPELLFHKDKSVIQTEALAATMPKNLSLDEKENKKIKNSLLQGNKEAFEHVLVSLYLENIFKENFNIDLIKQNVEIKELKHVFHLLQRFHANISTDVDEHKLISLLHPTPAVCGVQTSWAKDFIRKNEGFDRGFYAAPMGIIAKDFSEFFVAIRSGLYCKDRAFLYAASGIVSGSNLEHELVELSHKKKIMLELLTDDAIS